MARRSSKAAASAAATLNTEGGGVAPSPVDAPANTAVATGGGTPPVTDGAARESAAPNLPQQQSQGEADIAPSAEAPVSADADAQLVEITARSLTGGVFRRAGVAWPITFITERVTLEAAVRIATDPSLEVKALVDE